jgi:LytS/YehU family sensor histidine kinase
MPKGAYMKRLLLVLAFAPIIASAELVQQFKDPTFSGQGWASHVLTVEQMRQGATSTQASKAAAEKAAAEAAAANTPLAKFMTLFTGQVYSQLATQLTNNLFKDCVASASNNCLTGNFMVSDTQQIRWVKLNGNVTLTVYSGTKDANNAFVPNTTPVQTITVPISSFSF